MFTETLGCNIHVQMAGVEEIGRHGKCLANTACEGGETVTSYALIGTRVKRVQ